MKNLLSIRLRLEHITNLSITFNQIETNKEMNTTDADDDEVDCEKELVADDDNNDDDEVDCEKRTTRTTIMMMMK